MYNGNERATGQNIFKMFRKLLLCALITALSIAAVSGCSSKKEEPEVIEEPPAESPAATEPATEPEHAVAADNARIVLSVQEYIGDNVAEIPYIEYDGEVNPEIDSINRSVHQGIGQMYEDIKNADGEKGWIEIRSRLFTSDDYLQAMVWHCQYPTYGTDGNIFSINYDIKARKSVSVNDALNRLDMSRSDVEDKVTQLFKLEEPDMTITDFVITGFLISEYTEDIFLIIEIRAENMPENSWNRLCAYDPMLDELELLDISKLFEPLDTGSGDVPSNESAGNTDGSLDIRLEDGYEIIVGYYSNTYINDYDSGEKLLGFITVDKSDSLYDAVFECIAEMDIKQSQMSYGSIPSKISEFLLISEDSNNLDTEVFFYDDEKTVFFHRAEEYDSMIYVATPDEDTYYRLTSLIGEIRLGASDFAWIHEYSLYETLNMPMLYSSYIVYIGEHYGFVDENLNIINMSEEDTIELLSSINIVDRVGGYPSGLGKHMRITDSEGSVIGWIYFDTEESQMYIYPEGDSPQATVFGTYSITQESIPQVEKLLSYLQ